MGINQKTNNFTLIGMPAAGKSFLSKKLADDIGLKWVDLDTASYRKALKNGSESNYLEQEEAVLLTAGGTNNVFSCGGSSVYSNLGMDHLQIISTIIYLHLPLHIIKKRLGNYENRGIVRVNKYGLEGIYKERTILYTKYADHTLFHDTDSLDEQYKMLNKLINSLLAQNTNGKIEIL